ncbi:MAG: hypothetical protein AAFX50_19595, partial [Acidobacteriota bacterium]
SVSGGLGLLASGAAATGNPVTSQVASGLGAVARGQETRDWRSAGAGVASSVKTIQQIDAARTFQAQVAEAKKLLESRQTPLDTYLQSVSSSFKTRLYKEATGELAPQREVKSASDPTIRPGDLVRSAVTGRVGEVQSSGLIAFRELNGGVSYETSLIAGTFRLGGPDPSSTPIFDVTPGLFEVEPLDPLGDLNRQIKGLTAFNELVDTKKRVDGLRAEIDRHIDSRISEDIQVETMDRIYGAFHRKYREVLKALPGLSADQVVADPVGREYLSELAVLGEMQRRWLDYGKAQVELFKAEDQVRLASRRGASISDQLAAMQNLERVMTRTAEKARSAFDLAGTYVEAMNVQETTGAYRFTQLLQFGAVEVDGRKMTDPSQLWDFAQTGDRLVKENRGDKFWTSEEHKRSLQWGKDPNFFIDPYHGQEPAKGVDLELLWDLTNIVAGFTPADFI